MCTPVIQLCPAGANSPPMIQAALIRRRVAPAHRVTERYASLSVGTEPALGRRLAYASLPPLGPSHIGGLRVYPAKPYARAHQSDLMGILPTWICCSSDRSIKTVDRAGSGVGRDGSAKFPAT